MPPRTTGRIGKEREGAAGLELRLLGRRAADERSTDGAVLLALAGDDADLGDAAAGALEANDVRAGIERDGMTVERGSDRFAVEQDARVGDIVAVDARREHHAGHRGVELDERLRAVLANELGASDGGARDVARAGLTQLACSLQRLSLVEMTDALGLGRRPELRGRRGSRRHRRGGLLRVGGRRHEEDRAEQRGRRGARDQRHSTL